MAWRRTFDCPPPALLATDPIQRMLTLDERYRDSCIPLPDTESLQMTCKRVASLWEDTLAPALREGKNVLVVSHGNTLRALVKQLDGVSSADSYHLDLPTACPVVYEFNEALEVVSPCAKTLLHHGPILP